MSEVPTPANLLDGLLNFRSGQLLDGDSFLQSHQMLSGNNTVLNTQGNSSDGNKTDKSASDNSTGGLEGLGERIVFIVLGIVMLVGAFIILAGQSIGVRK